MRVREGARSERPRDPGAGQAPLPAPSVAALLRRNADDFGERPFLRFGDRVWTHTEYVDAARRFAALLRDLERDGRPPHVGVLLDNTPAYLVALGGTALAGAALVGLNHTRTGEHLARDLRATDVDVLLTEPRHAPTLEAVLDATDIERDRIFTARETGDQGPPLGADLDGVLADLPADDPGEEHDPPVSSIWCLVFTSGTSGDPKAVICTQRRMLQTGERMRILLDVTAEDVGYVAMPLFHSNALMVGVMPALVAGASVGLARRFTASGWLDDVRRYGATWFNYTGSPLAYILATPQQPDDADNPMRRGFGNEGSAEIVAAFERRFGVELLDAFGPTEGGIAVLPTDDTPSGALGRAGEAVRVVDEDGDERPRARLDRGGRVENPDEAIGEIVNTAGPGPFEGYYGDEEATERATRFGWYWTGDLGYVDEDGFLWFAGRSSDWLRVDGENFLAAPIERVLARHPDVVRAVVYGVPDASAGDQVMTALVLRTGAALDGETFAGWIDAQEDLSPKWRPRYLRVAAELPTTGTNKPLVRQLQREKFRLDLVGDDNVWVRPRGADVYRRFTPDDEADLRTAFERAGRERFWEL